MSSDLHIHWGTPTMSLFTPKHKISKEVSVKKLEISIATYLSLGMPRRYSLD